MAANKAIKSVFCLVQDRGGKGLRENLLFWLPPMMLDLYLLDFVLIAKCMFYEGCLSKVFCQGVLDAQN